MDAQVEVLPSAIPELLRKQYTQIRAEHFIQDSEKLVPDYFVHL